jgi:hypothetical protein
VSIMGGGDVAVVDLDDLTTSFMVSGSIAGIS